MSDLTVGRIAFAPGPWAAGKQVSGDWLIQSRPDSHVPPWIVQAGTVAAVRASDQADATAHLIAAAPDLLAAIKALLGTEIWNDYGKYEGDLSDVLARGNKTLLTQVDAAIAKAEGR